MTKDFNRYYFSRQMFIGATMFLCICGVASASPTALGNECSRIRCFHGFSTASTENGEWSSRRSV